MAELPNKNINKPLRFTIYSEGAKIKDSFGIISVYIYRAVNRVGMCLLTIQAGNMPKVEVPESDDDTFAPGKNISIEAGYGDEEKTVFEGIVTSHNLHITQENECTLRVECREYTYPMTQGRKNRIFEESTDCTAMKKVFGEYAGLIPTVSATEAEYSELVQYYCTDWDFILSRADANGLLVIADGKKITVKEPNVNASPVVKITYGSDLISFEGELMAEGQQAGVEATGWDPSGQAVLQVTGTAPALNDQGDLTPTKLAEVGGSNNWVLQTEHSSGINALKAWADGQRLKSGLSRIQGNVSFYGIAKVVPGCQIELDGLGKRFNGKAYIGSVEHEIKDGEWITKAGMGIPFDNVTEKPDVMAPAASGLLPGIQGLHIGKVKKLEEDPAGEHRIQVDIPILSGDKKSIWARLANSWSSPAYGAFFIPDVGDEVVLGFFNNDPCQAVILGSLYSSNQAPPYQLTSDNFTKGIVTKEKMKLTFNEEKKIITLETPGANKIVINDETKGITLTDQNNNKIVMNDSGIVIESAKDLTFKAKMNVNIEAGTAMTQKAKTDLKAEGMNVTIKAQTSLKAQGTASAELSASGQTTVKGAMVMIN